MTEAVGKQGGQPFVHQSPFEGIYEQVVALFVLEVLDEELVPSRHSRPLLLQGNDRLYKGKLWIFKGISRGRFLQLLPQKIAQLSTERHASAHVRRDLSFLLLGEPDCGLHPFEPNELQAPSSKPKGVARNEFGDEIFFDLAQEFALLKLHLDHRRAHNGADVELVAHADLSRNDFVHALFDNDLVKIVVALKALAAANNKVQAPIPFLIAHRSKAGRSAHLSKQFSASKAVTHRKGDHVLDQHVQAP